MRVSSQRTRALIGDGHPRVALFALLHVGTHARALDQGWQALIAAIRFITLEFRASVFLVLSFQTPKATTIQGHCATTARYVPAVNVRLRWNADL